MYDHIRTIVGSTYMKILFGGVMAFCGVGGGIYVGSAIVRENAQSETKQNLHSDLSLQESSGPFLNFEAGDLFPHENLWYADGREGNFQNLLKDKKAILLFVSFDCGPCIELLKSWNKRMLTRVMPDVEVFACMERELSGIPAEYVGLFSGMEVVFFDGAHWRDLYHMTFYPLTIGVDDSGFVIHVQFGFADYVDYALVDYFFKPN